MEEIKLIKTAMDQAFQFKMDIDDVSILSFNIKEHEKSCIKAI